MRILVIVNANNKSVAHVRQRAQRCTFKMGRQPIYLKFQPVVTQSDGVLEQFCEGLSLKNSIMEYLEDWSNWSCMLDLNSNADCKQIITKKSKNISCFEDILHHVGGWGPFQWYLTLLNFLLIFFLGSVTYFPILTLFTPQHFCKIEDLQNMTMESRRNLAIPADNELGKTYIHYD